MRKPAFVICQKQWCTSVVQTGQNFCSICCKDNTISLVSKSEKVMPLVSLCSWLDTQSTGFLAARLYSTVSFYIVLRKKR